MSAVAESLRDFMEVWYDRWAGPGEDWNFGDLAESIVEEWLPPTDAQVEAAARAFDPWAWKEPLVPETYRATARRQTLAIARAALEAARSVA